MEDKKTVTFSLGFASIAAAVISWKVNASILWALFHGFFGGLYLLYYAFFVL